MNGKRKVESSINTPQFLFLIYFNIIRKELRLNKKDFYLDLKEGKGR